MGGGRGGEGAKRVFLTMQNGKIGWEIMLLPILVLFSGKRNACYGCTQRSLLEQRFLGGHRFHLISESVYPFMVFCGRGSTQESSLCFQYKFTQ